MSRLGWKANDRYTFYFGAACRFDGTLDNHRSRDVFSRVKYDVYLWFKRRSYTYVWFLPVFIHGLVSYVGFVASVGL